MNFTEASLIAERCQRNWDYSSPISDQDLETLINVASNMPTKQNVEYYNLIVSTNLKFNEVCYKSAFNPDDPDFCDEEGKARNSQVNAPLLMIWVPKQQSSISKEGKDRLVLSNQENVKNNLGIDPELGRNVDQAIGISSGATAIAAAHMGFKTGFCTCMHNPSIYDIAKDIFKKESKELAVARHLSSISGGLFLGIGYSDDLFDRKDVVKDGKVYTTVGTYDKEVNLIRI